MPDNGIGSIYRDMAVGLGHPGWKFMVDVDPDQAYQVRLYLNGPGEEDDQYGEQRVSIDGDSRDSQHDRIFHDVVPDDEGRIVVVFEADEKNRPDRVFFKDVLNRRIVPGEKLDRSFTRQPGVEVKPILDNGRVCYLYGMTILPGGLGARPEELTSRERSVFRLKSSDRRGVETTLEADIDILTPGLY